MPFRPGDLDRIQAIRGRSLCAANWKAKPLKPGDPVGPGYGVFGAPGRTRHVVVQGPDHYAEPIANFVAAAPDDVHFLIELVERLGMDLDVAWPEYMRAHADRNDTL